MAPANVERIGIVGAGIQARQQLRYLTRISDCRDVIVWGIDQDEADRYKADMEPEGFSVDTTLETQPIAETCNLIVTVTPSKKPLLKAADIRAGTHITAVGADTPGKQELETGIFSMADLLVVDSISQVVERGESQHAFREGLITEDDLVELGLVIDGKALRRTSEDQITITDLTGVAVQDIQITKAVYEAIK
jgi:ornithine cyclodeaminase